MINTELLEGAERFFKATDQAALRCPEAIFDRIREDEPVVWVPEIESWLVSNFEYCDLLARDSHSFSNKEIAGPKMHRELGEAYQKLVAEHPDIAAGMANYLTGDNGMLISADPPYHRRQRALVNEVFSPGHVRQIEPRMYEWANRLIDSFVERGSCELVKEFSVPLPLNIISEFMGIDEERRAEFKSWSDAFTGTVGNPNVSVDVQRDNLMLQRAFTDYFDEVINDRRKNPRENDLTSFCLAGVLGEEPLTNAELLGMLAQFLVAGNETTANLITASFAHLMCSPDRLAELQADDSKIAAFIEEMLRLEAPVQGQFRTANLDYEIGGKTIKKGDGVLLYYAGANRDPKVYDCPGEVDLRRNKPRRHLAFGIGPHFCLGAPLARQEGAVAIKVLLERLKNVRLASNEDPEKLLYANTYLLRHIANLDLVFDKGAKA